MVLTDADQVRNLLGRYCQLIDAGDFAGVGALFAEATLCDSRGTVLARGADEVAGLYAGMTRRHDDGTPMTQHVVANTVLEPLDDDRVRATSAFLVLQATDSLPLQPVVTGTYVDTLARAGDGWRFVERRFGLGRSGDLSQHLLAAVPAGGAR